MQVDRGEEGALAEGALADDRVESMHAAGARLRTRRTATASHPVVDTGAVVVGMPASQPRLQLNRPCR
jgi:hypothetical protein